MVDPLEETVGREVFGYAVKELRDDSQPCVGCGSAHCENMEDVFYWCMQPVVCLA